jgi:hypothetical protein
MNVEGVRTRASTNEALLTLAVPLEQAALISAFLSRIGQQVGVAFADTKGEPLVRGGKAINESWKKLGSLCQSALLICKDADFQSYVFEMWPDGELSGTAEDVAARYMKDRCQITSRRDLDTVDGARERFGVLMSHYRGWLEQPE